MIFPHCDIGEFSFHLDFSNLFQDAIKSMPEFQKIEGDACFRVPKRKKTSVVLIQSFKPTTVSDTRRQIEDYCRDLIINNDHISQMEQRMRAAFGE